MISINLFRLSRPLVLAAVVAALAAPTLAFAGADSRYGPADGWYTYATSVTKSDRTGASDSTQYGPPDGWYTHALTLTDSAKALSIDGRSPDTLDAAHQATQLPAIDGRSPDTLDAAGTAQAQIADGRSPDTLDAAAAAIQPIEIVQPSRFDWTDAGIGAALGAVIVALLGSSSLAVLSRRRGRRIQAI